jgi:glutathione S-transferase
VRLQADHVNRTLVPAFYRYLQAREESAQIENGKDFLAALEHLAKLNERSEELVLGGGGSAGEGEKKARALGLGLWVQEEDLGWIDVVAGPCEQLTAVHYSRVSNITCIFSGLLRATNVLKHYRGFSMPTGEKFNTWLERLFAHPAFKVTCSTEEYYIDCYERCVHGPSFIGY